MIYKVRTIWSVLLIGLLFPIESCIESITPQLNENDSESMLVVAGQITNEEGPFQVKLTTSVPVNAMVHPEPVLGADVRISDDKGNVFQLYGDMNGLYVSADKKLKGVPGNTYTLFIITKDGVQYESSQVLMQEVPDIDSVYFEEVNHTRFENGKSIDENWLSILLDTHDPEGKTKYWHFEFDETWEVKMLTDYVPVEHSPPGSPNNITWERIIADDNKLVCWVMMPSNSILVANTVNNQVDEIKRFPLALLGPGDEKLHIRYSILVKQSTISRELYDFWKMLMDANENVGGIYDKVPARIYGNITGNNGTLKALGYFSASCVSTKRIFIKKTDHHVQTASAYAACTYYDFEQLPWIPKSYFGINESTGADVYCSADFCADCRAYGTNVKPDFWE